MCGLLFLVTLASYNPITRNQFIDFDDSAYIVSNPHVQQGITWKTIKWAFTSFYAANWHPLTWLSHAVDWQTFHFNAAGPHYVNLLLHALNAILLFLLLRYATGSTWAGFIVAALLALHPVNVESVAWAAERKNVLSMLFLLLAMLAHTRYARTNRRDFYWLVVILFALGLMAKPQVIMLPFVLLLWDYWPLERVGGDSAVSSSSRSGRPRSFGFLVIEKLPLFIIAAVDAFIVVLAQRAGNAVRTVSEVPWPARLANAAVSYVRYVGIAFWPARLAPMYPRQALAGWEVAGSVIFLVLVSVAVVRYRERRFLFVGWFWFLATLIPMIGIISVGEQAMADRYAYLPFIGLFVAVVWTCDFLMARYRVSYGWAAVAVLCSVVFLILGHLTYRQVAYWHDDETLWRYTLSVTKANYMAHENLAYALAKEGHADEAIAHFRAARELHQYPPDQIVKLGLYELRMGYPKEAVEDCRAVVGRSDIGGSDIVRSDNGTSANPQIEQAAFRVMGRAFLELRLYEEADQSYRSALRLAPDDSDSLLNSGLLALRTGDANLAVERFSQAAKIDPSDVNLLLLAQALRRSGQISDADRALAQAQKISPNLAQSRQAVADFLALADVKPL